MNPIRNRNRNRNRSRRGSALIVAVFFSSILALFVIPAYLKLSHSSLKMSQQTYYSAAAHSLAESGLEHALFALGQAREGNDPWGDWTVSGTDVYRKVIEDAFVGNLQGQVNVYIMNYESSAPEVVTKGKILLPGQETPTVATASFFPPLLATMTSGTTGRSAAERFMYANISSSEVRSLFGFGLLTREFITASGGSWFDSWNSDPDNDPATPYIPYSDSVAQDNVTIATTGTAEGAISIGPAKVFGKAAVGSQNVKGLNVGWGGQVGPKDDNAWSSEDTQDLHKKDPPGWRVSLQTGALATGFTADFEEISVPADLTPQNRSPYVLPYNKNGPPWYVSQETLGAPNTDTVLRMDSLTVEGGATLTIAGNVTLILPKTHTKTLRVIAGGALKLADGAQLTVYTAGDIEVSGAGILNHMLPQQFQIWGTGTEQQDFNLSGSGQFNGIIYAPNADIKGSDDADLFGSIVANSIKLTGSGAFHYDEALKQFSAGSGSSGNDGPPRATYVEELTGDERLPYRDLLDF